MQSNWLNVNGEHMDREPGAAVLESHSWRVISRTLRRVVVSCSLGTTNVSAPLDRLVPERVIYREVC